MILFCCIFITGNYSQKYRGEFTKAEFNLSVDRMNFFVDMFETKKQLIDFMEIKNGDIITEIGAAEGYNLGVLSTICDSVTFYAQDIDSKSCSEKKINSTAKYYSKRRLSKQTNKFVRVMGTTKESKLPENKFDKIMIINSFHDFDEKDKMLNDIETKLKQKGKLFILDGFSFPEDVQTCPDYGIHVLTTMDIELERFEKHGFFLTKMRSPYYNATHYGNALVFERDRKKAFHFYNLKNEIDPLVSHSFRFKQKKIASDSIIVKQITDSLLPKIDKITNVYEEFEVWIKDIGVNHLRKSEYVSAINIFKANTLFYPNSYQAFYWLGLAYKENKRNKEALINFNKALVLKPGNAECISRINEVKIKQ
ncbi:MAG: tetratricopeptide repeat protein [Bacteroidia bacterium]|nr:tetratricopeptide repeat protein [Bacteroidia bacterium]